MHACSNAYGTEFRKIVLLQQRKKKKLNGVSFITFCNDNNEKENIANEEELIPSVY